MVLANEYYGQKAVQRSKLSPKGVPATNYAMTPHVPTTCQGITKDGVACKAKPIKTRGLCVGHVRKAEAENSD